MMFKAHSIIAITLGLGFTTASADLLAVKVLTQEHDQWCWAGSSRSVAELYGFTQLQQCDLAEYARKRIRSQPTHAIYSQFGDVNCCLPSTTAGWKCNYWNYNWGNLGSIEDIWSGVLGLTTINSASAYSETVFKSNIDARKPMVVRIGWDGGGGHFIVGRGYVGSTLHVMDPWYGKGAIALTYASLQRYQGNGTWTHSQVATVGAPQLSSSSQVQSSSSQTSSSSVALSSSNALSSSSAISSSSQLPNCATTPSWTAKSYDWVATKEYVTWSSKLWSHTDWVNGEPGKDATWKLEGTCPTTSSSSTVSSSSSQMSSSGTTSINNFNNQAKISQITPFGAWLTSQNSWQYFDVMDSKGALVARGKLTQLSSQNIQWNLAMGQYRLFLRNAQGQSTDLPLLIQP